MAKKNNIVKNIKNRATKKADQMMELGRNNKLEHKKVSTASSGTGVEPPFMEHKKTIKRNKER